MHRQPSNLARSVMPVLKLLKCTFKSLNMLIVLYKIQITVILVKLHYVAADWVLRWTWHVGNQITSILICLIQNMQSIKLLWYPASLPITPKWFRRKNFPKSFHMRNPIQRPTASIPPHTHTMLAISDPLLPAGNRAQIPRYPHKERGGK